GCFFGPSSVGSPPPTRTTVSPTLTTDVVILASGPSAFSAATLVAIFAVDAGVTADEPRRSSHVVPATGSATYPPNLVPSAFDESREPRRLLTAAARGSAAEVGSRSTGPTGVGVGRGTVGVGVAGATTRSRTLRGPNATSPPAASTATTTTPATTATTRRPRRGPRVGTGRAGG